MTYYQPSIERWMVYSNPVYEAVPWPFTETFEQFVGAPRELVAACDHVGRASPTDGTSEMPTVPAGLPRGLPKGNYQFAVYHDAGAVYVVFESRGVKPVARFEGGASVIAEVSMLTTDGRWMLHFRGFSEGEPKAWIHAVALGPTVPKPAERSFDWTFKHTRAGDVERCCWRIARASIADVIDGSTLRMSISHADLNAIEAVAWGAYQIWDTRADDMATARLVKELTPLDAPRVRRVDLHYAPYAEWGALRVHIDRPFGEDDTPKTSDPAFAAAPMNNLGLTFNEISQSRTMRPLIDWLVDIPDGHSRVRLSHSGGAAVQFGLEKWSGRKIRASPIARAAEPFTDAEIAERIKKDCDAILAEQAERRAQGAARPYRVLMMRKAAALGRAYKYGNADPRILDALRDEADHAITLQREDGTFSGFHLEGRPNKKAVRWAGGAYDSGPAGELWTVAAWVLGDAKYLEASRRLVKAYATYRIEFNHNFSAIGLYHLAAHYRLTREAEALEHALHYAQTSAAVDILPLGFQAGHNYYSVYGCLTLRGMAQLCSVLPREHPYRDTLRELCIRMTNQMITRLQPSGLVDARNRHHIGDVTAGARGWQWAILAVGLLLEGENAKRLDGVFCQMMRLAGDKLPWCDSDLIRYASQRKALLEGGAVDLMALQ